jgi:hypothetical protein
MSSILKVDEIQNTDGKTGLVITPDGSIDGIKFPEEANPSGRTITSTTMSSYEEGTWVPVLETGTALTLSGRYTKVGNIVTFTIYAHRIENRTSPDRINFSLPFSASPTVNSGVNTESLGFAVIRYVTLDEDYYSVYGNIVGTSSDVSLFQQGDYKDTVHLRHDQLNSTYNWIRLSGHYYTDE